MCVLMPKAFLLALSLLISLNAHAVIKGTTVKDGDPVARSTVSIEAPTPCTGSLIASDIVLTAAHCLMEKPAMNQVRVMFWAQAKKRHRVRVHSYAAHPGFRRNGNRAVPHDLALIRLLDAPPEGFGPAELLPDSSVLRPGDPVVVAGFGRRKADDPESMDFLHRATASVLKVFSSKELLIDSRAGGTCLGDSGGPAFYVKSGRYFLYGVIGSGDADCAIDEIHTRIDAYRDWIEKTVRVLRQAR